MPLIFLVQQPFKSLGSTSVTEEFIAFEGFLSQFKLHPNVGFFWMIDFTTFQLAVYKKKNPNDNVLTVLN